MSRRTPGFRFNNGRLLIFTQEETNVIHTWPDLASVRKSGNASEWTAFIPQFRLLRPVISSNGDFGPAGVPSASLDPLYEKVSAFINFRYSVPPEVARAIENFSSRQMALLRVCAQRQRATELLQQNPALGFCAAHNKTFRASESDSVELAVELSKRRLREVAGWLGFPDSQSWVNILSKIPAEVVDMEQLVSLCRAAGDPDLEKMLCHLPSINAGVLALVTDHERLVNITPKLLLEVAAAPEEKTTPRVARSISEIVSLRSLMGTPDRAAPLRSIAEVQQKQQEISEQYNCFLKELSEQQLPDPPLPGTDEIVPIEDSAQLWHESQVQHNCVASYAEAIHKGRCYIYRVLSPERATLSIAQGPDGCWRIDQLYRACNLPVSAATEHSVCEWLRSYSVSI